MWGAPPVAAAAPGGVGGARRWSSAPGARSARGPPRAPGRGSPSAAAPGAVVSTTPLLSIHGRGPSSWPPLPQTYIYIPVYYTSLYITLVIHI